MLMIRKMRLVCIFRIETLALLSGVLLVRFLSLVTENEHINSPLNRNLSTKKSLNYDNTAQTLLAFYMLN